MGEDQLRLEVIPNARCAAAGSLEKALKRARDVISMEFKTPDYVCNPKGKLTCSTIRASWDSWMDESLKQLSSPSRRHHRLAMVMKSTKRIFDVPCRDCDRSLSNAAIAAWEVHVGKDVPEQQLPNLESLRSLRLAVRELLDGWGTRLDGCRNMSEVPALGEYVPDQQGCYEAARRDGGTMSVPLDGSSGDYSAVRVGVAKTKGKFRVVTMQSAEVKRVLTPVHNALYNHITSFGWCVRGDVQREDFVAVAGDLREGEVFISGDYKSATDNIFLSTVDVIVDEIAKSPELTEEERRVLVGSFSDLRYKKSSCALERAKLPIKRGSMMGNLVSFPLLCLLNKACWDIACDVRAGGRERKRVGRFNGDDCMFAGDTAFFETWRRVTAVYGLIVNEEKTGCSRRWLELNSQSYDVRGDVLVSKATLGFLRPARAEPGGILAEVVKGMAGFSKVHLLEVILLLRHEISLRGVQGDLGCLGPWLRKQLVRMRWFRSAAMLGGAPVIERGTARSVPMVIGPPPRARFFDFVTRCAADLQRDNVNEWTGKKVVPLTRKLDRKAYRALTKSMPPKLMRRRFEWRGMKWAFVWPRDLYEMVRDLPVFAPVHTRWFDDHPFLTRCPHIVEVGKARPTFFPPPVCLLRGVDNLPRLI